jgi:hypothetical protein
MFADKCGFQAHEGMLLAKPLSYQIYLALYTAETYLISLH